MQRSQNDRQLLFAANRSLTPVNYLFFSGQTLSMKEKIESLLIPFSIFAHESRSVTVLLNTSASGLESIESTQK